MSAKPRKPKAAEEVCVIDAVGPAVIPAIILPVEPLRVHECPEADPALGMKTPAVVAWWFEHFPEEAAVKYAGLTLG